jgi:D-glycero-alpha-D-manno-heptose-7-phosphate kinase
MFESINKKILNAEELSAIRTANSAKKIVFCTGCYDILQSGHAVFFNQCKQFGDILIVGIGRDSVIEKLKGPGRPVNPQNNRLYLVAALQEVDFAVLNGEQIEEGKIDFRNILENLRPDVFIVNDDDSALSFKEAICKKLNIKMQMVSRVVPVELQPTSTSQIIDKINFSWRAPLRIDFAGGWTDVPFIMEGKTGYVSNVAIKPLIELRNGQYNFSGYPRGSGLSTSTAVKVIEMISAKAYNADSKSLSQISEDLFRLENRELNWAIGRQDQYSIVYGGFNCFEFNDDSAKSLPLIIKVEQMENFRKNLLLIHSGVSRNAQSAVEEVYQNYKSVKGKSALTKIGNYGQAFAMALNDSDYGACASIMEANFEAQKELASSTSNEYLDEMYVYALRNGSLGGKICGAGGGGAFIFYCKNPVELKLKMKKQFVDCFEIDFEFEYSNIKQLNKI